MMIKASLREAFIIIISFLSIKWAGVFSPVFYQALGLTTATSAATAAPAAIFATTRTNLEVPHFSHLLSGIDVYL
jgi:hypothetical protein